MADSGDTRDIERHAQELRAAESDAEQHAAERRAENEAASRNEVSRQVGAERRAASANTFGFYLVLGMLLAAILVGGIYFATRPGPNETVVVNAAPRPANAPAVAQTTAAPRATVLAHEPPPPAAAPGSPAPAAIPPVAVTQRNLTSMAATRVEQPDLFTVADSPRANTLVGKRVHFDGVYVPNVIADRAFWITDGRGGHMLAALAPALDQGFMEHVVRVKPGQNRTFSGVVLAMPSRDEAIRRWKLDSKDAAMIADQRVYVQVDAIEMQR